ncbi:MAG: MinD/ParA family protein [Methylococcaceae bacterium]|jgi:flagellar biosynthesis protein FlhG
MAAIIAITSGKGGVGKTNIAVNLALALTAKQAKVCVFDADTGLANVNILLGLTPKYSIEHVLRGEKSIAEVIIKDQHGIDIMPAASGVQSCTNLTPMQLKLMVEALETLENSYDYLLIDTAAGIDNHVLDFVVAAQYRIVVVTPEPTSLTDAFALIKMLIKRGKTKAIFILVNNVANYEIGRRIFKRFQTVIKKYLAMDVHYLGYVAADPVVLEAIAKQVPVFSSHPDAIVSCCLSALADIVKRHFLNEQNVPYFSHYWKQMARQSSSPVTADKAIKKPWVEIYRQLSEADLKEVDFKELIMALETVFEKKYGYPARNLNQMMAMLLVDAQGGETKIIQMHTALEKTYERQFGKKITGSNQQVHELMADPGLTKEAANTLLSQLEEVYRQRFGQGYWGESLALLENIKRLLAMQP